MLLIVYGVIATLLAIGSGLYGLQARAIARRGRAVLDSLAAVRCVPAKPGDQIIRGAPRGP